MSEEEEETSLRETVTNVWGSFRPVLPNVVYDSGHREGRIITIDLDAEISHECLRAFVYVSRMGAIPLITQIHTIHREIDDGEDIHRVIIKYCISCLGELTSYLLPFRPQEEMWVTAFYAVEQMHQAGLVFLGIPPLESFKFSAATQQTVILQFINWSCIQEGETPEITMEDFDVPQETYQLIRRYIQADDGEAMIRQVIAFPQYANYIPCFVIASKCNANVHEVNMIVRRIMQNPPRNMLFTDPMISTTQWLAG